MPRQKKQRLKQRPDGRYVAYYKGKAFYGRTEDEAFSARDDFKRSEVTGEAYNRTVTVFEYGSKWLKIAHPAVSDSTFKGLAIHLQHLVNQQGNTPIHDVKPLDIKAVYSVEYKTASNSYIKSAKQLYVALFDSAVADGICKSNPARQKSAQPHKGTEGGHRAITEQERQWINTFCHDHRAYPAVITMLYAGIRPQEAKALTIEKAFDKDINVLHITETALTAQSPTFRPAGFSLNCFHRLTVFFLHAFNISFKLASVPVSLETAANGKRDFPWESTLDQSGNQLVHLFALLLLKL